MKRFEYVGSATIMTIREIIEKMDSGVFTSDIPFQRGDAWDTDRRSFFMDSVIKNAIIPHISLSQRENGIYVILDGKQRTTTLWKYIHNEFNLQNLGDDMEDVDGLGFDSLEDEQKDSILNKTIGVDIYTGLSFEDEKEMFFRLNNGRPLTNFEQVKARCKSLDTANMIVSDSEIFDSEKTGRKSTSDKNMELVFKAWIMLYMENPSLEKKNLNPVIMDVKISDEEMSEISDCLQRVYEAFVYIKNLDGDMADKKVNEKVCKRIVTPTHLLSILPFAKRSIEENRTVASFALWLKGFYNGTRRATADDTYNDNATRGSAKESSIRKRLDCLARNYEVKFID